MTPCACPRQLAVTHSSRTVPRFHRIARSSRDLRDFLKDRSVCSVLKEKHSHDPARPKHPKHHPRLAQHRPSTRHTAHARVQMEKRFTKWKESFHHPDSSAGRSSYGKPFCPFSGQNFSAPQLRPPCFAWPDSCPP